MMMISKKPTVCSLLVMVVNRVATMVCRSYSTMFSFVDGAKTSDEEEDQQLKGSMPVVDQLPKPVSLPLPHTLTLLEDRVFGQPRSQKSFRQDVCSSLLPRFPKRVQSNRHNEFQSQFFCCK
jgi:hypothetical protein